MKTNTKPQSSSYCLLKCVLLIFHWRRITKKSRKWHIVDYYLNTFYFLALHVLNQDSTTIWEQITIVKWHFTMWHTTKMFGRNSAPCSSPVLYHAIKTVLRQITPFYKFTYPTHPFFLISCRSLSMPKHVIWNTHLNISCRDSSYQ